MKPRFLKQAIFTLIIGAFFTTEIVSAEKYALILGTNYTGSSPISDLALCEADARVMKSEILKTGNFKSKNMTVLLGSQVDRKNVKKAIDSLAAKVKEGDQVFFFFAGHGTYVRDSKAKNGMRNYIVMYNRPHLSDDELSDWFAKIETKKAVIIVDACFSGGIAKKGAKVRGEGNIPIPEGRDSVVLQDLEKVYFKDKVVIGSSDDNETAIELGAPVNHGVFTYYFSKAMNTADLNNDKKITAYEAFYKARNETKKTAAQVNHKQVPQISGNASGFFFVGEADEPADDKPDPITPPGPNKPDPPEDPEDPPIDDDEPENEDNNKTGTLVLNTTYRQDVLKNSVPEVYLNTDKANVSVSWVNNENWGRVARLTIAKVKSGVYNVSIKANGYTDHRLKTGVEEKQTTEEDVLVSKKGRGAIRGHVWVENFSQPFANLKVFLSPVRIPKQPRVRTKEDGSFAFHELKPGKYRVFIVGGLGYFTRPYNAYVTVEPDTVSDVEIVLKETVKKGKLKKHKLKKFKLNR